MTRKLVEKNYQYDEDELHGVVDEFFSATKLCR